MKLPNGDQAIIDRRKITDYCLCRDHDDGQHKAHVFESVLGLTLNDVDDLIAALPHAAVEGDAVPARNDRYGQRYVVDFMYTGHRGCAWIVRCDESVPRLVTCLIL